ncbi:hypothetical protein Tco_1090435 [Tanacetum coccineum]|uniref:Uncharacterized protein n=1 Tax=Tanacetum coccineum TaxID=301880 RepID=A0ABQ5I5V4_9ASTR
MFRESSLRSPSESKTRHKLRRFSVSEVRSRSRCNISDVTRFWGPIAAIFESALKPTRMSIRLANHTYQYPMGVAENMLVQDGKFVFLVDFVILQMEEDDKVLLILG